MTKVVLITGGSSGIGEAVANYLFDKGFSVYGTSRNPENSKSQKFELVEMDVTSETSIRFCISSILEKEGRIDVVVNNAGLGIAGSLEETDFNDIHKVFDTNVFGLLKVCRSVIPVMRTQKSGLIINVSSVAGVLGLPFRGIYSASKFAVEGLTEALSMEVKPFGIKVCSVLPGDIKTNINANRIVNEAKTDSPYFQNLQKNIEIINEEVAGADDPIIVAKRVLKIISTQNPSLRYLVGSPIQKLSVGIKSFLPSRVFEKIIMKYYKLK